MDGKKSPRWGKQHTEETKEKIREKRLLQITPYQDTEIELLVQNELKRKKNKV